MYELGTDRAWDRGSEEICAEFGLVSSSTWFKWRHCNIQNNKANKLIMLYTTIHIQCFGQFKALKSAYLSLLVLWKLGAACRIKSSTPAQVLFSIPGHA